MRGAVVGGNFPLIRRYSSTFKNRLNRVSVIRRDSDKGLILHIFWKQLNHTVLPKPNILPKDFTIFVTFRKHLSRKEKINFPLNSSQKYENEKLRLKTTHPSGFECSVSPIQRIWNITWSLTFCSPKLFYLEKHIRDISLQDIRGGNFRPKVLQLHIPSEICSDSKN